MAVQRSSVRPSHGVAPLGDALLADAFPDLRADVVVARFLFGIHDWGRDRLAYDPRWVYGVPPRTEPELAWVQHALAHLTPGGTAVVLMPPAAAGRPPGRRIRAELVRRGIVRAVVALPAGLMPPAGIGLHLWVLVQHVEGQPPAGRVLFVDAAATDRPLADLAGTAWHNYVNGRHTDEPGALRAVAAIDLLDEHVDLTPQRYLLTDVGPAIEPARTVGALAELDRFLAEVRHAVPAVRPASTVAPRTAPRASLADLVRAGGMSILRAPARTRAAGTGPATTVLTSADILAGGPPTGTVTRTRSDEDSCRVQVGDVLVPAADGDFVVAVATAEQVDAELGPGVQALRIDPDRFDPWFVASVLSNTDPRIAAPTTRLDLKRRTIPVMPLQDQRAYGAAFRQLAGFRAGLERAAAAGTALVREISNGLAAGVLTVDTDRANASSSTVGSHRF
jgi:hypothetical protein